VIRFYIVSESRGLVAVANDQQHAEYLAAIAAVNTGRTVYLHDRQTEESR
jgi:hypothetical protein